MYIRKNEQQSFYLIQAAKVFLSLLIIYYFWYNEAFSHSALIVYSCFFGACICIALHITFNGISMDKDIPLAITNCFVILVYTLVTGLVVSYNKTALMADWIMVLKYSAFAFMICYVSSSIKSIDWVLRLIILTSAISAIQLNINGYHAYTYRVSLSSHNNPNALGIMLSMGVFSIVFLCKKEVKSILFSLALITLLLFSIVETGSRKSFIVAVTMVILWMITFLKWIYKSDLTTVKIGTTVLLSIFIGIIVCYYLKNFVGSNLQGRLNIFNEDDSNESRINYYRMAWNIFLDKPLFGGGLLQFAFWSGVGTYSHSTFAESIADFGFIGSTLYFVPLLITWCRSFKKAFYSELTSYKNKMVFFFICGEVFLAFVTILFSEVYHYVGIAIACWYVSCARERIETPVENREKPVSVVGGRYVKN